MDGAREVRCPSCGRAGERYGGITADGDSWFHVRLPWALYGPATPFDHDEDEVCSLDCAVRFLERVRPFYEEIEADLIELRGPRRAGH